MGIPLRVLVVEDSEDDTLFIMHQLSRGGYDVTYQRVETASAMNSALDRERWDIVISDHSMPNFSSLDALSILKKRGLDLPFILVSGSIGEGKAVEAMKAGVHDYIFKDNLSRLIPAIGRELKEAEVRRVSGIGKGTKTGISGSFVKQDRA
jgi:DNA-binding NtrC family response regulator